MHNLRKYTGTAVIAVTTLLNLVAFRLSTAMRKKLCLSLLAPMVLRVPEGSEPWELAPGVKVEVVFTAPGHSVWFLVVGGDQSYNCGW